MKGGKVSNLRGLKKSGLRPDLHSSAGQAMVELALMMLLIFGFFLFFVQLSLILSWGHYVQYATYMSARAYLSAGPTPQDQEDRAREVISKTVRMPVTLEDRFPMIARGEGPGSPAGFEVGPSQIFDSDDRATSWMQGVRYTFRSRLFLLPLGSGPVPGIRGSGGLKMTSEAWLGRDPSFQECLQTLRDLPVRTSVIDNGC